MVHFTHLRHTLSFIFIARETQLQILCLLHTRCLNWEIIVSNSQIYSDD